MVMLVLLISKAVGRLGRGGEPVQSNQMHANESVVSQKLGIWLRYS